MAVHKVYIVLTHSGTVLSNIIKGYTKDEFSHVSISLDKNLKHMYSFGRLKPSNPIFAGFIHENIDTGTFNRFPNTNAAIFELNISNKQYHKLKKEIHYFNRKKRQFKFNIVGLIGVAFNKKIKSKYAFYCAEFVKYILEMSKINNNLPAIIKPEDFKYQDNLSLIYKGNLKSYYHRVNS